MKEILTALMIWISANTYYNTDHPLPDVVFLPQDQMNHMYYKDNEHNANELHGMYDKENDTIILPDTWDIRKAWDKGVLLHEMIHYYQDQNKLEGTVLTPEGDSLVKKTDDYVKHPLRANDLCRWILRSLLES